MGQDLKRREELYCRGGAGVTVMTRAQGRRNLSGRCVVHNSRGIWQRGKGTTMKKMLMAILMLTLFGAGAAFAQPKPVRIYIAPNSLVPPPDIMKYLVDKCPNVSLTLDAKKSDYMLLAWGWSGNYRFTVYGKGGVAVYGTSTVRLGNAVKDVCKFVNVSAGQGQVAAPAPPPPPPPSSD